MKINLEKLREVEEKYKEQGLPYYSLHLMLQQVITFQDAPYNLAPNNVILSMNTLKDLGILEIDTKKETRVQQLNS